MAAEHGGIPPTDAVLFILVSFSVGIFLRMYLKWARVPYTAMLLLVGLGIGFLQLAHPATTAFSNTLQLWLNMEPHLLLLVFLPIIGFSAAIGQEPHMLRKSWGQIMLLAWPGVVIQFLLIGAFAKYCFPYGWTWPQSFLFGAMMSATDPVAVVAVLQEVGASQKLACVIDGESLMNDGSALVIFLVLQKIVEGEKVTPGGAIAQFCLLAVVGMLLGIAFGVATSWLLEHIFRDNTLTTVVTLLSAYASYYCADSLVGASGLLAVVCNGFTMSLIGGKQITMRAEHSMHAFWSVLEWGANTILFVWMGILLAIVLPPSHESTAITNLKVHLVRSDAGYMFALFLWLQVARAALILLCWWPFRYTGYPLTWRSALVFVWAGLRGAVGMVMGLFIFLDDKIHDESFRSYCVFYIGTSAFLTILINGGTTKWLLRTLGFMSYTPEQLTTLQHVVQDMDAMRDRQLAELGPDEVLGEPEPDAVKVWSTLPTADILAEAAANTVRTPINMQGAAAQAAVAAGLDPQLLYDYRCRILHMLKAHYAEAYSHHLLNTLEVRTLHGVADKALDEAGEGLTDWALLQPSCELRGLPKLLRKLQVHRVSGTLVQAAVYQQNLSNLTLLVGFISAHRHAQEVLSHHIKAVGDEPVVSAAILARASRADSLSSVSAAGGAAGAGIDQDPMKNVLERFRSFELQLQGARGGAEALFVLQESEQEAADAIALAERLTSSHPSLPAWLRSKQVAATVLTEQHAFLTKLSDAGLVQQRETMLLEDSMHDRFRELLQSNTGLAAALQYSRSRPAINLLPLFDSLDEQQVARLMKDGRTSFGSKERTSHTQGGGAAGRSSMSWKVFYPEQVVATAASRVDSIIVITKGAVRMQFPESDEAGGTKAHTVVASVGDPLGVCELMLGRDRAATLTADSMVQALLVPAPLFLELVVQVPGVHTRAWQATAAQLAAQHHHILGEHKQLAPLNLFFRSCHVERMQVGRSFDVPRTALLLTGSVKSRLPLPRAFILAVSNPARTASAADLLWPDNILGKGDRPAGSSQGSSINGDSHGGLQDSASSAANAEPVGSGADAAAAGESVLTAPAELPPGEFECVVEAMVLQVPRGPRLPDSHELANAQSVLHKVSFHPQSLQTSRSLSGVASLDAAGGSSNGSTPRAAAAPARTGSGFSKDESNVRSPFKDALARLSRAAKGQSDEGEPSSQPRMPSLQLALQQHHHERRHQAAAGGGGGGSQAATAGAGGAAGLHTVLEVRQLSGRPGDANGAPEAQQQQQRLSTDLRATDVVLRKRL